MNEQAKQRALAILARRESGETYAAIAKTENITPARVRQLALKGERIRKETP